MQDESIKDWTQEFLQEKPKDPRPKLKIQDGDQINLIFLDEGKEITSVEYGKAILFAVKVKEIEHIWFVGIKKFTILKEIAHNKPITNKNATVTRVGTTRADTRWKIVFPETKKGEA